MGQQTSEERIADALERVAMLEALVEGFSDSLEIVYARLLALRDVLAEKGIIATDEVEARAKKMRASVEEDVERTHGLRGIAEVAMGRLNKVTLALLVLGLITLNACGDLVPRDVPSLLDPKLQRSEVLGILAGFGTTFAALPDLIAMLKRRSSAGMNPRMAAIMGIFQILWVYYGLLIASRPVIVWNVVAVFINFFSVGAYLYFVRAERRPAGG
jgi:MtN3 and saliva related transmembrane protein